MKNLISKTIIAIVVSMAVISCEEVEVKALLETYPLQETSLHPEAIAYHGASEKTFVGSYYKGKIITVDLAGNRSDFILDDDFVAVVGIAIDEKNNRLLVCNSDAGISQRSSNATIGQLAEVRAYDLTTGDLLKVIDLSGLYAGGHFLNDLVLDLDGNVYVTDSFSPVVYKIDQNDSPSVFVTSTEFEVPQGAFGLNGLVYHSDGYLIVGKAFGGVLYKVPLSNPTDLKAVTLSSSVNSLDGLLLTDDNTLALVSNNFTAAPFAETVYEITTTSAWTSATVARSFTALDGLYPTSLTMINDGLFVTFGYFPELVDPNATPHDDFKLQKVLF